MKSCGRHSPPLLLLLVSFICLLFAVAEPLSPAKNGGLNKTRVSALLVFGDSTVDAGNNNFINTIFRSNFPPYGKDFDGQVPTGRFSNGRLGTDFIVSYVGIKDTLPPYLDPSLSIDDLLTGVSFASAGSGFDLLTPTISNVVNIPTQLGYFREYKRRVESAIGKQRMEDHIRNAFFFISAGTNDFVVNYFTLPIRPKSYSVPDYEQFVLQNIKQLVQALWDEGARRMAVVGLPPMGCLPIMITLHSPNAIKQRNCLDIYSSAARDFNHLLQNELNSMQKNLAHLGSKIFYIGVYDGLNDMIQAPSKFGFDEVNSGCCGTGYLEASLLCNPKSYLCNDASKYVFFDSIHPSEKAYYNLFKASLPILDMIIG